ncbi:uncharacterized protein N7503_002764 [Penicillium pulvis]|uniref:uncharacterized protein n=1 Tax=Penicillium pulvis TaxID=1562058 RepID=UPI0025488193|nr:uncharacterized protein N7503_002764 [Penicillium pulvis]KAJ5810546.1 hypothetical protein N7503_002764 [Penicillium pulvis]
MATIRAALPQLSSAVRRNAARQFHSSPFRAAVPHPITAHGPPPKAPAPSAEFKSKVRQSENESSPGEELPSKLTKPSPLKSRFWKDVHVHGKAGEYQVLLDKRPVRTPNKDILSIPPTKPQLAHAIALEWDVMTSAQQALKSHLIPLTSLAARAEDIVREDARGENTTRSQIVNTAMRYLETDTLLCWEPERQAGLFGRMEANGENTETLREIQIRVSKDIMSFLSTKVWPGLEIKPILDADSILPVSQPPTTKETIQGWVSQLAPHDLAGLERGILASKSLLVAVRLLVEWSENFRHIQRSQEKKFGLDEAAEASSLEVKWQTDMWGEVEDTHDVAKEDMKRQLGSVVILVSGETR